MLGVMLADHDLQKLKSLPLPRHVQLTPRGILHIFVLVPVGLALIGFLIMIATMMFAPRLSSDIAKQNWPIPAAILVVVIIVVIGTRQIAQERKLLTSGSITLGQVYEQRFMFRGHSTSSSFSFFKTSLIRYSFTDQQLRVFQNSGRDYSKHYREGMWLAVFYDPSHPVKNVAAPCTLFTLHTRPS